jgi:hypothetical protein
MIFNKDTNVQIKNTNTDNLSQINKIDTKVKLTKLCNKFAKKPIKLTVMNKCISSFFFCYISDKKSNSNTNIMLRCNSLIKDIFDANNITLMNNELELLKSLLLTPEQKEAFQFISRNLIYENYKNKFESLNNNTILESLTTVNNSETKKSKKLKEMIEKYME